MALSVGFIGVGNMGNPMASNVLKNFALTVFDKSAKAMANLVQAGAKEASSSKDVADRCEIVMTCLPASPDVEALYLARKHRFRVDELPVTVRYHGGSSVNRVRDGVRMLADVLALRLRHRK